MISTRKEILSSVDFTDTLSGVLQVDLTGPRRGLNLRLLLTKVVLAWLNRNTYNCSVYMQGKVTKQQEFYSKQHGNVLSMENIISGNKMSFMLARIIQLSRSYLH